jgi:hypothetical protein
MSDNRQTTDVGHKLPNLAVRHVQAGIPVFLMRLRMVIEHFAI